MFLNQLYKKNIFTFLSQKKEEKIGTQYNTNLLSGIAKNLHFVGYHSCYQNGSKNALFVGDLKTNYLEIVFKTLCSLNIPPN